MEEKFKEMSLDDLHKFTETIWQMKIIFKVIEEKPEGATILCITPFHTFVEIHDTIEKAKINILKGLLKAMAKVLDIVNIYNFKEQIIS